MDTQLVLNLNGLWQQLDLYDDIPISVMIQETDITDFQGRKSAYTKQFTVPATAANSKIFEMYFEVNGIDFNPLVKIDASVLYRGTEIFKGICRLNSVTVGPTKTEFDVYLMGDVADFISELKDLNLAQLDWSDLQHSLTFDNLVQSWSANNTTTDGLLGGQVLYPLINYGLFYQDSGTGATPSFTYAFTGTTGFQNPGRAIPPSAFKPAVRLKTIVDKIFAKTSYTINSEFFNSDYFRSMYMDTFQNSQFGTPSASGLTNQNIFKVYTNPTIIYRPDALDKRQLNFQSLRNDGYNPLGTFTLGPVTPNQTINPTPSLGGSLGTFRAPFAGQYYFNFKCTISGEGNIPGDFVAGQFHAQKSTDLVTWTNFRATVPPIFSNEFPTGGPLNWFFDAPINAGEYVRIVWTTNQSSNKGNAQITFKGFNQAGISYAAPVFDVYNSPTILGPPLVDFGTTNGISTIQSIDFFKTLIKMFNLIIIVDEFNKTLKIEPYTWYYDDNGRIKKDFTQKLDLNSSYKIEPLSFDLSKQLQWTYLSGEEENLNWIFRGKNQYNYGRYEYISDSNLLTGDQLYETVFAPIPTDVVPGSNYVIIPQMYRNINGQQLPYASKPHIFFWTGNRYCYKDINKTQETQWYVLSGATPVKFTTYPAVSHLSSLDIYLQDLVSDLNFGSDVDFFNTSNPYPVQFSPYTLYNVWWKDYIDNNYSNETRRLSAKFYMTPLDVTQTKLNDKIFIKDSFYRIEKITEGNLVENKLTDISLIKERGGYYKVIPPSPYYYVNPSNTFPLIVAPNPITVYISTRQQEVCLGVTTTQTVYVYNGSTLFNGATVVDNPSSNTPIPQGTFLRDTTSSQTYVVINNTGQVITDNC